MPPSVTSIGPRVRNNFSVAFLDPFVAVAGMWSASEPARLDCLEPAARATQNPLMRIPLYWAGSDCVSCAG